MARAKTIPAPTTMPEIRPATLDRWDDVVLLLGGDGDIGCWCQDWRGKDEQARGESRPQTMRRQLSANPPPGYIAYRDGQPVGWVGVSVRTETPRLLRSRTIPAIDDLPVWAIGCFKIRVGFRRQGVAIALLDGVVAAARRAGAPGLEAYPVEPDGKRINANFAYVGIASMFEAAGFRRVQQTGARSAGLPRQLYRLMFEGSAPSET